MFVPNHDEGCLEWRFTQGKGNVKKWIMRLPKDEIYVMYWFKGNNTSDAGSVKVLVPGRTGLTKSEVRYGSIGFSGKYGSEENVHLFSYGARKIESLPRRDHLNELESLYGFKPRILYSP